MDQLSGGEYQRTMNVLGGPRMPPGTRTLTGGNPTVPSTTSLFNAPPVSDMTSESEEVITGHLLVLPHATRYNDKSPDDLLKEGDLLFCGKGPTNDARVSCFELSHVNEILYQTHQLYLEMLKRPVNHILQDLGISTANLSEDLISLDDYMTNNGVSKGKSKKPASYAKDTETLLDYLQDVATYKGYNFKSMNNEREKGVLGGGYFPSDLEIYLLNPATTKEEHQKFNFAGVYADGNLAENNEVMDERTKARMASIQHKKNAIHQIMTGNPNIFNYITIDGIMSKLNFIGPMVSSQDDSGAAAVAKRAQIRNLNIALQGPCRVFNRWGDVMNKGTYLFLTLRRRPNRDGTFGEFFFEPYYSPVKQRYVPLSRLEYRDLSGKKEYGISIYIGSTRYAVGANTPNGVQSPKKAKVMSYGGRVDPLSSSSPNVTLWQAYAEKAKLETIEIYFGM
jgi:hypothetical protein